LGEILFVASPKKFVKASSTSLIIALPWQFVINNRPKQGCQILIDTMYQKRREMYQAAINFFVAWPSRTPYEELLSRMWRFVLCH
jgi:hypothetical protein